MFLLLAHGCLYVMMTPTGCVRNPAQPVHTASMALGLFSRPMVYILDMSVEVSEVIGVGASRASRLREANR
jgi:hypothetical protein